MNIFKRELRSGIKSFILWTLGLFVLVFVGMVKFTGINGGAGTDINVIFDQFPRVVLAVFGMVGVDITTLGGYYAVIIYFALICIAIYGVSLGVNAVNRESVDKTYEFIFTKPRARSYILAIKLLVPFIYLVLFSIINCMFSFMAVAALKFENTIGNAIVLYSTVMFLIGMMFLAIGAFLAVVAKRSERGALYGNLSFLAVFILSIIYDMLENVGIVKIFAPLKYFAPQDILEGRIDFIYVALCLIITILLGARTFMLFNRKDLIA